MRFMAMCRTVAMFSGAQAVEVFMEDHVEHPVQAVLDVPVAADGAGEQARVDRRGAEIVASFAAPLAAALDLGLHHGDGGETWEARFAREAPVAGQEGDVVADGVTAQLDAARVGVGGLVAVEPDCVLEEALDLAMQVRPVLLDGEQVVGPAPEDRLGSWSGSPSHRW